MSGRVFLSYASGDAQVAKELVRQGLPGVEFSTWSDVAQIGAGESIASRIAESVNQASAILLLVSEESLASAWMQFELGIAWAMDKPVVPVLVGPEGTELALPVWLRDSPYVDARGRQIQEVAGQVEKALKALHGAER